MGACCALNGNLVKKTSYHVLIIIRLATRLPKDGFRLCLSSILIESKSNKHEEKKISLIAAGFEPAPTEVDADLNRTP